MTRHEDQPRPRQPLAEVELVLEPTREAEDSTLVPPLDAESFTSLYSVVSLSLEPHGDDREEMRVLRILDRRSGLPILETKLAPRQIVQLFGGKLAHGVAWLLPQPERKFLGRWRTPLTVRLDADYTDTPQGRRALARWVAWGRERLEPLGLVDYHERRGVDKPPQYGGPVMVCTFVLYPDDSRKATKEERDALRTVLTVGAGVFDLPLPTSEREQS